MDCPQGAEGHRITANEHCRGTGFPQLNHQRFARLKRVVTLANETGVELEANLPECRFVPGTALKSGQTVGWPPDVGDALLPEGQEVTRGLRTARAMVE